MALMCCVNHVSLKKIVCSSVMMQLAVQLAVWTGQRVQGNRDMLVLTPLTMNFRLGLVGAAVAQWVEQVD